MPLKKCQSDNKQGYKWGDEGTCYTGPNAKQKAIKQGIAIEGPEKFSEIMKADSISLSRRDCEVISDYMIDNGYGIGSAAVMMADLNNINKRRL